MNARPSSDRHFHAARFNTRSGRLNGYTRTGLRCVRPENGMPSAAPKTSSRIGVTISDDRMTASVLLRPGANTSPLVVTEIVEALQTTGVLIDDEVRERAEEFVTQAAGDETPESFIVAKGTPPEGRDEIFVLNPALEETAAEWLADAPVDFYTLNNIITVEKDSLIGTITPIVPPKDGRNVEGEVVTAKHVPVALKLDNTVRRADDHPDTILASVDGKVIERNNTLSIDETLVIKGDVGFETGNIDSKIAVHINGGIPDRFEVKSLCGVTVAMSIEGARVSAGGDVTVSRGIVGRGVGLVTAGGSITFKFCVDAHLIASGDVKVSKQSMNSHLCVGGSLIAGSASIVGGTVFAMDRVDLAHIGSQRNIPTQIVVGVHPDVVRDLALIEQRIERVEKLVRQIRDVLAPLRKSKQTVPAEQAKKIKALLARADQATKKIAGDKERRDDLLTKTYTDTPSSIHVSGTIYAGTVVRVADRQTTFHKDMKGPICIEKRKLENVTELVAVNTLTASIKILSHEKRTPIELIDGFELEEDETAA